MAGADRDVIAIVWGETRGLSPRISGDDQARARLQAVITKLANSAKQRGLDHMLTRMRAPPSDNYPERAAFDTLCATANLVADEQWTSPTPLPARAALWEINDSGAPRRDPALPKFASWIYETGATSGGEFVVGGGADQRIYRLFESTISPDKDELPYISGYTRAGILQATAAARTKARNTLIAWIVGSAAAIVFLIGGLSAIWSGQRDGVARSYLSTPGQEYKIVDKLKDNCLEDAKLFPSWKPRACNFLADENGKLVPPPIAGQKGTVGQANNAAPAPAPATSPEPSPGAGAGNKPEDAAGPPNEAPKAAAKPSAAPDVAAPGVAPDRKSPPSVTTQKSDKSAAPRAAAVVPQMYDYGPKVGQTIALIKKCLNIGPTSALDSDADKPADKPPSSDSATTPSQQTKTDASPDDSCDLIARSAAGAVVAPGRNSIDGAVRSLLGLPTAPNARSIVVQLLLMTFGIAGLAVALGLGTKGRIVGIWIDERNRVSLARAQVTLWTIVALGGFATVALYNIGLDAAVKFPRIPGSIMAALGIAFGSPILSALILDKQQQSTVLQSIVRVGRTSSNATDFRDREVDTDDDPKLEKRDLPSDASLADVFVGEHVADCGQVDISRLQNVILTVTLVLGYFAMLLEQAGGILPESVLAGLPHLPDPDATFTSVLLVSHATYLGTKAYAGAGAQRDQR
ncbi:hypothetical protein [Bradyrhizobium sp. SZCCHNS1054]|uniref:hypothetical protein n=1 Tax=Bradyrhizobium sp. SZCCHNS1054 TaxID=3057301 RepID=UPI002916A356|nr:hypothetical protein [Bradyrhizobium sp. SZCCHNS1054]